MINNKFGPINIWIYLQVPLKQCVHGPITLSDYLLTVNELEICRNFILSRVTIV